MIIVNSYCGDETVRGLIPDLTEGILERAHKALLELGKIPPKKDFVLELTHLSNTSIIPVNKAMRGKDYATDVLSVSLFSEGAFGESFNSGEIFGEIYISLEKCAEQAKEIGQSFQEEYDFLIVHGILHIFGYDHQTPDDEKEMMKVAYGILGRKR